ncbi:MAG: succinate dehydrogenase, hydrophobic membrane anchor protein [Alphaproteobacteria bacterium]|nr:succinate dehydrogenase, hydrophobic membrane anchor protein [Alphaproteobacteria bacterium]MCB9928455.1 succinate dehydrogenase, hydrophobic membrane anchor protein [Alphaproteobacteria bacterium]
MSLRSPLGTARGLGSAKSGTHHWIAQRVTAIALIPLTVWFVIGLIAHAGASYEEARAWIGSPVSATLMICLIASMFYHAQLGLQVVIEDYIHAERCKIASLLLVKGAAFFVGVLGVLSVVRIAFGG